MQAFGMSENPDTYQTLLNAYKERHRFYHTLDHINACFLHLAAVTDQATYPHEIELALWFHDVVYKPFSGTNEEDSAELARTFLVKNNVAADSINRIYDLIILTKDHIQPETIDAKLMLDIDLSILGASETIYAQFENHVRREYRLVPGFMFRKKRKEILRGFFDRPSLYHMPYFYERFEKRAKRNLKTAIGAL